MKRIADFIAGNEKQPAVKPNQKLFLKYSANDKHFLKFQPIRTVVAVLKYYMSNQKAFYKLLANEKNINMFLIFIQLEKISCF